MKKLAKKFISFFLVIIFICSFSTIAYADTAQPRITFVATLQIISAPKAGSSGLPGVNGHSFIIVKNDSNATITVGHMPVGAGDSVTVGTYGNRNAHKGIWYNIEGYARMTGTYYGLSCGLTMSDVYTITNVINANDTWSVAKNCSYFAKTVWNAVYASQSVSGVDPLTLANSIQSKSFCVTNPSIPYKEKNTIARHTSSGYIYDSSGAYKS